MWKYLDEFHLNVLISCNDNTRGVRMFEILNNLQIAFAIQLDLRLTLTVRFIWSWKGKIMLSHDKWPVPACSTLHRITPVYAAKLTLVHRGEGKTRVLQWD